MGCVSMDWHGWHHDRKDSPASIKLVGPTWSTILHLYREGIKLSQAIPIRRELIVSFAFQGTTCTIDCGDVKGAGVICILGIGIGLGSLLVYKLFYKYIHPYLDSTANPKKKKNEHKNEVCVDDECLDEMGNTHSDTLSAYYNPAYGVAFGPDHSSRQKPKSHGVHHRTGANKGLKKTKLVPSSHTLKSGTVDVPGRKNSDASNKKSNRDSAFLDCDSICDDWQSESSRPCSLTNSLKGNFSPTSLYEKNLEQHIHADRESSNQYIHDFKQLYNKSSQNCSDALNSTEIHSDTVNTTDRVSSNSVLYDSLYSVISDSNRSGSCSVGCESSCDWSWDEEERDTMSPLPQFPSPSSERTFRQSLLQRLRDWKSNSSDSSHSSSVTPDRSNTPDSKLKKTTDLDDASLELLSPDSDIFESNIEEPIISKNYENLQDEILDIQQEFNELTSKIAELKQRALHEESGDDSSQNTNTSPLCKRVYYLVHKAGRRLSNTQNLSHTDSEESYTDENELTWDNGDIENEDETALELTAGKTVLSGLEDSVTGDLFSPGTMVSSNTSGFESVMSPDSDIDLGHDSYGAVSKNSTPKSTPDSHVPCHDYMYLGSADEPNPDLLDSFTHDVEIKNESCHPQLNVGEKCDIISYAHKEWKSDSDTAQVIKQGYMEIPKICQCKYVRRIRGDNYCAIRSTLYQCLCNGILFRNLPSLDITLSGVKTLYSDHSSGLYLWTFANRLPYHSESRLSVMESCLKLFYLVIQNVQKLSSCEERIEYITNLLNSNADTDIKLMEAVKLLMACNILKLYSDMCDSQNVPVFVWLLFARDGSESTASFIKNHLNCVGDSGGLEQVEMCLLGYTLGVCIQVFRLIQHKQQDFLTLYPEECSKNLPSILLISEDDRHYNVLC